MDINLIRENPEYIKLNQRKRFLDDGVVDTILEVDSNWVQLGHMGDQLRQLKNTLSKSFRNAPKEKTVDDCDSLIDNQDLVPKLTREQLKNESRNINAQLIEIEDECARLLERRDTLISGLGNLLHAKVPIEKNEDAYDVLEGWNLEEFQYPSTPEKLLTHIELVEKLGMVDTISGIKVAGNRGYFLKGNGVKLNRAIISYAQDFLDKKGYTLVNTPHIMETEAIENVTQLSDYEETLYKLQDYDKYLIATSEQPLTAQFAGQKVRSAHLPIKLGGFSTCYRKETGAHGKHTRGIYRVHQFEKVEQFCITDEDNSWDLFDKMMNISKEFYDSLELPYRIINIPSGDLNNAASMKHDLEAYYRGSEQWCELVSCTNCLDYFSKRINTKSDKEEYVHMLNCTLCANTRTLCAIVETYQTDTGMIVPEVLRPYMNGTEHIDFE